MRFVQELVAKFKALSKGKKIGIGFLVLVLSAFIIPSGDAENVESTVISENEAERRIFDFTFNGETYSCDYTSKTSMKLEDCLAENGLTYDDELIYRLCLAI